MSKKRNLLLSIGMNVNHIPPYGICEAIEDEGSANLTMRTKLKSAWGSTFLSQQGGIDEWGQSGMRENNAFSTTKCMVRSKLLTSPTFASSK